jgi:hypothetical protein
MLSTPPTHSRPRTRRSRCTVLGGSRAAAGTRVSPPGWKPRPPGPSMLSRQAMVRDLSSFGPEGRNGRRDPASRLRLQSIKPTRRNALFSICGHFSAADHSCGPAALGWVWLSRPPAGAGCGMVIATRAASAFVATLAGGRGDRFHRRAYACGELPVSGVCLGRGRSKGIVDAAVGNHQPTAVGGRP